MNVLITGCNGQLGSAIYDSVTSFMSVNNKYIFSDITENLDKNNLVLDATNYEDLEKVVKENNIDVIVNCAAYTNVDAAEDNEEAARKLNMLIPRNLNKLNKKYKTKIVHISTDYVHDHFTKEDKRTDYISYLPLSMYGKTKYLGEREIYNGVIIRTSWLYYLPFHDGLKFKNFVTTMIYRIKELKPTKVVSDQYGSPTNAINLAVFIIDNLESNKFVFNTHKIINYSNVGICSWYEFAKYIAKFYSLEELIEPCKTEDYPTKALRPKYSALSLLETTEEFGCDSMNYWKDTLLENLKIIQVND